MSEKAAKDKRRKKLLSELDLPSMRKKHKKALFNAKSKKEQKEIEDKEGRKQRQIKRLRKNEPLEYEDDQGDEDFEIAEAIPMA